MSRSKDLAKNTLILSIGTFLPKIAALITVPIITGHLTKIEYGTYDLLMTLVTLILPVVTLQIHYGAFRFLIEYRDDKLKIKEIITNIYLFVVPASVIGVTIMYFCLGNIEPKGLVAIYCYTDIILAATQQIVRGLSLNKLYSISSVVQSTINCVLVIVLVDVANKGLDGVLIAFIIATTTGISVLLLKCNIIQKLDFRFRSWKTIKEMLKYSWPIIPNSLSNWVLSVSDRFVLTAFMGLESTAIYGVAYKIPSLITAAQGTFVFAWQENASLAYKDDDVEEYYSSMFDHIFSLICGVTAILICVGPLLFKILIKGDYSEAYGQMPLLYMGLLFSSIASYMSGIYVAHKKTASIGITTTLAAVINLIIDLGLVKIIGIYAASISTLVSYMILSIYRMIDVQRFQKIKFDVLKMTIMILCLAIACAIFWTNSLLGDIINGIVCVTFAIGFNKKTAILVLNKMSKMIRRL